MNRSASALLASRRMDGPDESWGFAAEILESDRRAGAIVRNAAERGWSWTGLIAQSVRRRVDFLDHAVKHPRSKPPDRLGFESRYFSTFGAIPEFISPCRSAVWQAIGGFPGQLFGHVRDGNLHYNVFPPEGSHPCRTNEKHARGDKAVLHDLPMHWRLDLSGTWGGAIERSPTSRPIGDPSASLSAIGR